MELMDYVDNKGQLKMLVDMVEAYQKRKDIKIVNFIKNLPKRYIRAYIREGEIYKEVLVDNEEIVNLSEDFSFCSWMLEPEDTITKTFSFKDDKIQKETVYKTVYMKKGEYVDFVALTTDLVKWLEANNDYARKELKVSITELIDSLTVNVKKEVFASFDGACVAEKIA